MDVWCVSFCPTGQSRTDHFFNEERLATPRGRSAFRQEYRISHELFCDIEARLANGLAPAVGSFRSDTLSLRDRIAIPLAALGSMQEDIEVAKAYGLGVSTIPGLIDRFAAALIKVYLHEAITLPDAAECSVIAEAIFRERGALPFYP